MSSVPARVPSPPAPLEATAGLSHTAFRVWATARFAGSDVVTWREAVAWTGLSRAQAFRVLDELTTCRLADRYEGGVRLRTDRCEVQGSLTHETLEPVLSLTHETQSLTHETVRKPKSLMGETRGPKKSGAYIEARVKAYKKTLVRRGESSSSERLDASRPMMMRQTRDQAFPLERVRLTLLDQGVDVTRFTPAPDTPERLYCLDTLRVISVQLVFQADTIRQVLDTYFTKARSNPSQYLWKVFLTKSDDPDLDTFDTIPPIPSGAWTILDRTPLEVT